MKKELVVGGKKFDLCERALVMGVINITPDSFSDGGRYPTAAAAAAEALRMIDEGADIIDVGGESTRPGARSLTAEEELNRVIPVVEAIRRRSDVPISIDTYKAAVASAAVSAGADMINDISGLRGDQGMLKYLRSNNLPVIIMHSKGTPEDMQRDPRYDDVVGEIKGFLAEQGEAARAAGIPRSSIVIDPGIGFGKTVAHNLTILKRLSAFARLGYPLLVGPSRKSFIGAVLGLDVTDRLEGTLAAAAIAVLNGADILRLHDVRQGRRAVDLAFSIRRAAD